VPRGREQLVQHDRVGRWPVGEDLDRPGPGYGDGPVEEPRGRGGVTPSGDVHVDDLPELIDRPVDVAPLSGGLDVGLVDLLMASDECPGEHGGTGGQGGEQCRALIGFLLEPDPAGALPVGVQVVVPGPGPGRRTHRPRQRAGGGTLGLKHLRLAAPREPIGA
jgi:hypothetical protein